MSGNEETIQDAITASRPGRIRASSVLDLLDTRCRRIGAGRKKAALSALLIFKVGHYLFLNDETIHAYLSTAFQIYSRQILAADPKLSGLLYLSSKYDKTALDANAVKCLRSLLGHLARGSVKAPTHELTQRGGTGGDQPASPWASTLGDLSIDWFNRDEPSQAAFSELDEFPHFVKSRSH
jgi:hypothetical protein